MVNIPSKTSLEKMIFHCQQLSIRDMIKIVFSSFSQHKNSLCSKHGQALCMLFLSSYVHQSFWVLKTLSLGVSFPVGSFDFWPFLPRISVSSSSKGFEEFSLGTECSKVLYSAHCTFVGVYVSSHLLMMAEQHIFYE